MEIYSCIVILGVVVLLSAEKNLHISRRHKRQVGFDGQAIGGAVNSFLHGFLNQYQYNERPFGTLHQFEGQGSDHNHRWNHNQGNGGCNSDNGGCQHGCRFARGRKRCYCNSGYFLLEDRQMCSDIDECSSQYNIPCQDVCTNTEGSYKCGCSNGLTLLPDGSCISSAVGESCSENNGGCHQLCRDRRRRGGVRCKCSDGYKLGSDRRSCFDIDECSSGFHDCGQLMCVNTNGSYQCKFNSNVLVTADPCKDSNGGCQHSCVNANGTVQCHCEAGFQLVNGKLCQHVMLLPTDQPFLTSFDPSSTTSAVPSQTYRPSTVTFSISKASTTISPRKNECGINTKKSLFRRIVGGKPADPKDWPWMAALLRSPEGQQFCGGTLITDKHVLTAAHCVQTFAAKDIRVRLGEYKFSSPDDSNPTEFKVEVIRKHEGYNTQTQENDIAILKLDRSAVFSDSIWPACLPPSNNSFEDQPGYVIGWGTIFFGGPVSSVLQEVVIPVWKQGDCVAAYPDNKVSETMMCCGQKSGGKDSCQVTILRWSEETVFPEMRDLNISEVIVSVNNSDGTVPFMTHDERAKFQFPLEMAWERGLEPAMVFHGFHSFSASCLSLFENEILLGKLKRESFDVAIVDLLYNECELALAAHYLGLPIVGYWGLTYASGEVQYMTAFNPPSVIPHQYFPYSDKMTFLQRVLNTVYGFGSHIIMQTQFSYANQHIQKYMKGCPHPSELLMNLSGLLINSNLAFDYPRQLPPSFINIGGFHINEPKPLQQELQDFLDSAENGVILFSLGLTFDSKAIPSHIFDAYFAVFSRLKQKVVVKSRGKPAFVPSNVMVLPFFSQNDILAHRNTILFLTHCGMHGTMEGIYHGVKMIGIPIFFDQINTAIRLEDLGVGVYIEKSASEMELFATINRVLTDPKYDRNVKKVSRQFRSNLDDPTGRAVRLIEHVMEFDGANYLKMQSRHLTFIQYFLLDVILFLIICFSILLYICYKFYQMIINFYLSLTQTTKIKVQ